MTKKTYPPVPLAPQFITAVKSIYDVTSDHDACQPEVLRPLVHQFLTPAELPEFSREDRKIKHNNIEVNITIVRPPGSEKKVLPVIMFMHGGGWVFGDFNSFGILPVELALALPACVIFVDYSLSPEVKYPVALEECYATLCWIQQNSTEIYVDAKKLAVMGDSCGGNLASALTILAKERKNNGISYQVLYFAALNSINNKELFYNTKDKSFKPLQAVTYIWEAYVENEAQYELPTVAPLRAPLRTLEGLPPALIVTAEDDVIYTAENEEYARKLNTVGVNAISVRFNGVDHGFITLPVLTPQAKSCISFTAQTLRDFWFTPKAKL